jgi:hypothetical protein
MNRQVPAVGLRSNWRNAKMITVRATLALAALGLQAGFATASAAAEDEPLPPPPDEPMMIVSGGEGEAAELYPEGQVFPASAYICLPENSGFVAFELADGETRFLVGGGCNISVDEVPPNASSPMSTPPAAEPAGADEPPVTASYTPPPVVSEDGLANNRTIAAEREAAERVAAERRFTELAAERATAARRAAQQSRLAAFISSRSDARARTGAIRGGASPHVAALIVIRGSERSLAFYPVGSRLADSARLCLPAGAGFITLQRTTGGTLTYGDGGCNRVIEEPEAQGDSSGVGNGP